jgi:hypothetical protein
MRHLLLSLGAVLASVPAHADQCALVSPPVAARAAARIKVGDLVVEFCEPCGDKAPGLAYKVTAIDARDGRVFVNGKGVDVAYLYVKTASGDFQNVGVAVACGAANVSEWIKNGKPSGPTTRPAPPPPPPMPPRPPNKINGPDDLQGDWKVTVRTRYSSCPNETTGASIETRWMVTVTGRDVVVTTQAGELVGELEVSTYTNRGTLHGKVHKSGAALQLSQFSKDFFGATLLRGKLAGTATDPVCIIHQDVMARRVP